MQHIKLDAFVALLFDEADMRHFLHDDAGVLKAETVRSLTSMAYGLSIVPSHLSNVPCTLLKVDLFSWGWFYNSESLVQAPRQHFRWGGLGAGELGAHDFSFALRPHAAFLNK